MRPARGVFRDLAVRMVGFGAVIGLVFPQVSLAMGVPAGIAMRPAYFAGTIAAGLLVGAINWYIARRVVGERIRLLAGRMRFVATSMQAAMYSGDWSGCDPEGCRIPVDSDDEIGESAASFNRLVETLARSHAVERALSEFSKDLTLHLEVEPLAADALRHLMRAARADGGAVLVEEDGQLAVRAAANLADPAALTGSEAVRSVLDRGRARRATLPEARLDAGVASFPVRETLLLPVSFKQVPLAVIVLAGADRLATDADPLLDLFARALGVALNNALTHQRLQRVAALDALTGCYNRRFGERRLEEEFARAVRSGQPLGILMFDLDRFKRVNDTYGHLAGDAVLCHAIRTVRQALREGDDLIRFGGEEFVAVMPGASLADVEATAERIRARVADREYQDDDVAVRITMSLGGAAYPCDGIDGPPDLLRLADEALYRAKARGRNRTELARNAAA